MKSRPAYEMCDRYNDVMPYPDRQVDRREKQFLLEIDQGQSKDNSTETHMNQTTTDAGRFDIARIAATLPETATTLLVDHYLTNREAASARVFRVYKPTPPHYHASCDEYLYVFSGRGTFWMKDENSSAEFGPGELLFFKRGTVHALPKILENPVIFISIDAPRRDPKDIIFVNPEDGTPESFIRADNARPDKA